MSEKQSKAASEPNSVDETAEGEPKPTHSGPTFTESPDPLSGVRKSVSEAWASTEGKSVSMRVYIGSILGVIILMTLARCGG